MISVPSKQTGYTVLSQKQGTSIGAAAAAAPKSLFHPSIFLYLF